jgi:hypothetical protein
MEPPRVPEVQPPAVRPELPVLSAQVRPVPVTADRAPVGPEPELQEPLAVEVPEPQVARRPVLGPVRELIPAAAPQPGLSLVRDWVPDQLSVLRLPGVPRELE